MEKFEEEIEKIRKLRHEKKLQKARKKINKLEKKLSKEQEDVSVTEQRKLSQVIDEKGRILQAEKNLDEAIECFEKSLGIREGILRDNPEGKFAIRDVAYSSFQLPRAKCLRKDPEEEIKTLFEAAKLKMEKLIRTSNNPFYLGDMYHNLGFIEQFNGNPKAAASYYRHALKFRKKVGDERGTDLTLARIKELGTFFWTVKYKIYCLFLKKYL